RLLPEVLVGNARGAEDPARRPDRRRHRRVRGRGARLHPPREGAGREDRRGLAEHGRLRRGDLVHLPDDVVRGPPEEAAEHRAIVSESLGDPRGGHRGGLGRDRPGRDLLERRVSTRRLWGRDLLRPRGLVLRDRGTEPPRAFTGGGVRAHAGFTRHPGAGGLRDHGRRTGGDPRWWYGERPPAYVTSTDVTAVRVVRPIAGRRAIRPSPRDRDGEEARCSGRGCSPSRSSRSSPGTTGSTPSSACSPTSRAGTWASGCSRTSSSRRSWARKACTPVCTCWRSTWRWSRSPGTGTPAGRPATATSGLSRI